MKKIIVDNVQCAYIIKDLPNAITNNISFFSDPSLSLQVGGMSRKKGEIIIPHRHLEQERKIVDTQEVLFILDGEMKVLFYDNSDRLTHSEILLKGDLIHLFSGAHGFEISNDCVFFEVKQGPYSELKDKKRLS